MRKIMLIFFVLIVNINAQSNQELLDSIKDSVESDIPFYCIEYNVVEAKPLLEEHFNNQTFDTKRWFLEALNRFNSEYVPEYSDMLFNQLKQVIVDEELGSKPDFNIFDDFNNVMLLINISNVVRIQMENGNFNNTQYIFDIHANKTFKENSFLSNSLNYSNYKYQAKEALEKLISLNESQESLFAVKLYAEHFPESIVEVFIGFYQKIEDSAYKRSLLSYVDGIENDRLMDFYKSQLVVENNKHTCSFLIKNIAAIADLKEIEFLRNYLSSTNNEISNYSFYYYNRYMPPAPDSTVTSEELLDSLISYNHQCYQYGWLASEELKNKFDRYLNFVKVYLPEGRGTISKMILNKMIEIIQTADESVVSVEATKFLGNNAVYLVEMIADGGQVFDINNLTGSVGCIIQQNGNARVFNYEISNDVSSSQSVFNSYVSGSVDSIMAAPAGWQENREAVSLSLIGFSAAAGENSIAAGSSRDGFSIASMGLPGIGNVYLQSERPLVDSLDVFGNSFEAETIVPVAVPGTFVALEFVDKLIELNNLCLAKGWYTQSWAHNVQKVALDNTRLMLTLNVPASSLIIMQQFLLTMDSYHNSGFLTDDGFYLLKPNCDYLISKLQQM